MRGSDRGQLARALRGIDLPLSFAQQRLWFLDRLDPGTSAYTIAARRQFHGPLDLAALANAFTELVRRQQSLRTTFPSRDGDPVQRISDPEPIELEVIDLKPVPPAQRASAAWRTIREQAQRPFDLARGPLFRPVLIALAPEEHELLVTVHHIVADGWSLGILDRELTALYAAGRTGRPSPLPELPIQYGDFALWQRQWLAGEPLESQRRYWHEQLAGRPAPLDLPTDHPRLRGLGVAGGSHEFAVPRPLADRLRALSQREKVTLFMTLLAAFKMLLARYSGQEDILVGTPVANRNHVDLESVIGFFANTLVLRTAVAGDPTFRKLLGTVRETCLGAYAHPDMPFEKLVEELQPERALGQNPLFQVSLVLQDAASSADFAFVGVDSPFDLTLFLRAHRDGTLNAAIQYKRGLFEPDTIARFAAHYCALLEGAVQNPDCRLSELPILDRLEAHQLLVEWNATTTPYPRDRSVHGLFRDRVTAAPDAVAVAFDGGSLTYRELDRRSNDLAHHLRALGIGPECRVGVLMERSADMIVGFLGILKAGGAYAPLDILAPSERLAFMLADAKIDTVLTQARMVARFALSGVRCICVDADVSEITRQLDTPLEDHAGADDLAYVMYTSGSTGVPQGVAVPHRGVVRLVTEADYARLGADEVFLQLAPASFDASTFEIWGALLNGARLVIAPPGVLSVEELGAVLARYHVTILWLAAGLFEQVVDAGVAILRPLRQLLVGGDVLSPVHVRCVLATVPGLHVINCYGPTEATTFTCCHAVTSVPPPGLSIPIGRPIANTRVYVLDRYRRPVPIGVPGELWIGGDGLACGYVNGREPTAKRFVVHRLSEALEERLYRTGDRVRWLREGTLEFLGRLDDQIKVRGFRVEPGEIEVVLARHPNIRQCVVVGRDAPAGGRNLVAYVVGPRPEHSAELREFLGRTLPEYMVPATIVMVDRLPLTRSGKVDRRALPDPAACSAAVPAGLEPRDELEQQLAAIWQEILSTSRVGVQDNFFDLGGHSLLAVRMFALLGTRMGIRLPLATLFQAPTIEGLARVIRGGAQPGPWHALVAIQPSGNHRPVFAVPGLGGNVFCFTDLARFMGRDQPFYGLQSRGVDGTQKPLTRIEDIASAFLDEIREVQPEGPYSLLGSCMGGIVAYEMAQQLRAKGQEVELLMLLETWTPLAPSRWGLPLRTRSLALVHLISNRLRHDLKELAALRGRQWFRYVLRRFKVLREMIAQRDMFRGDSSEFHLRLVEEANLLAYHRYQPRAYPGQVVFYRAGERDVDTIYDRRLAWRELVGRDLEVHTVPGGDSGDMLIEPHVQILAREINRGIERTQLGAKAARGA